jgi:AraC-like DNA-binding protein
VTTACSSPSSRVIDQAHPLRKQVEPAPIRCEGATSEEVVSGYVSDGPSQFVQKCQVSVVKWPASDYAARISAVWECLRNFPRDCTKAELITATTAVCLLSTGVLTRKCTISAYDGSWSGRTRANSILAIVATEYGESHLTLSSVAGRLGLTQSYVSRTLSRETGYSFRTHLNGFRLLAAVDILRRPQRRVKEAAIAVGYVSTGELDRQFKHRLGLTPRQFARLVGGARSALHGVMPLD